ncbi:uncharacterized protein LOC129565707 [Sitodiplosis mosellana]|uniref:uncharacterized protein LOC129565707 n=1 Tax=Sitodiplosis mosellana TaxID=263140 RepID=UPI0024451010|nr:uncharacterized protein LOC129565707 [Sitodiplosis mosellana]
MQYVKKIPILPLKLHRRINRLVKIDDILVDDSSSSEWEDVSSDENESESQDYKICVESRLEPKPLYETKTNWIYEYCGKIRKDRVIWDTKLYAASRKFKNKSMYEQVEELMDISAEDFAECINKLTDDESQKISKEMIKKLFSIEIEKDLSHSLFVQKIHKPVVSQEIAQLFECPELAIERNMRQLMEEDEENAKKISPKYHAFGRSLSPKSRQVQIEKFKEPEPFTFPDDIRSGENLFKGIDHLKATKALMNHLDEHNLPKPTYLLKMNALNPKSKNQSTHIPLYSLYQQNKF